MMQRKIKKSIINQRRERYKKFTKKRIILIVAIMITIIGCTFAAKIKYDRYQERIYANAEVVEDSIATNDSIQKEEVDETENSNLDNSGYKPLEKDSNAEDAMELYHVTKKLNKNEIKYPVRTDGKKIAYLTFDDGPSTTNTPQVLDILKENGIKATFMILGSNAESSEESKEILKRTVKEGHAIGNHTYCHDMHYLYPNRVINPTNFVADVEKCDRTLKGILGKDFTTRVVRFPGGYWSWEGRENMLPVINEKGYACIDWNAETADAEGKPNKTADELVEEGKKELNQLGPNADNVVFLMHDTYGKGETVKSLQRVIDMFKEKGFEFKTIK